MNLCQICYTNQSFVSPCNCRICIPCLIDWFGVKNGQTFKCPNQTCNYIYTRQELQNICNYPIYQLKLSEILLKEYRKNLDIRSCPYGNCKNFGFIDLNNRCDFQLQCTSCNMKWTDLSIATQGVFLDHGISNMYFNIKDFIFCFLYTKECPQCGVQIQRNGGCNHMTCKACRYQYCWQCKNQWSKHKQNECSKHLLLVVGIQIAMIMTLFETCGLLGFLFYLVSIPFSWTFLVLTANIIPFGFVVGIVYFCYGLKHLTDSQLKLGSIEVSVSTVSLTIWYFIHDYITYYFDYSMSMYISIIMWEGIIAVLLVCYLFRQQLTWIIVPISTCCFVYFFGLDGLFILADALPYMKKQFLPYQLYFYIGGYLIFILLNLFSLSENFGMYLFLKLSISLIHIYVYCQKQKSLKISAL